MLGRILSVWFWSDRHGFCLGTSSLITLMLLMHAGGIQASLSLGPGGDFPRFRDVFLYAFCHDELPSLLVSVAFLLLAGQCQEQRWGTVAYLLLSILTMTILPLLYALVLFVGGGEASRICGYSAIQLALFTAQCGQVKWRWLLRFFPVWFLPWLFLLICLLLLPGIPVLFHFCAICIGHNYNQSFIGMLQEMEEARILDFMPDWAYVLTSARFRLPTYTTTGSLSQMMPLSQADVPHMTEPSVLNHHPLIEPLPSIALSELEVLDEHMLKAGILASLQDTHGHPDAKVEVPKSSVSSLRLQQLEKMGFPTEKAVVALAASKQLDGAIALLIDDSIGEQAVVVSKGRNPQPPQGT
ncbi:Rhomboid domain-containing protein 3 [Channa argus]|uniref:Rhomboid domain-containing protein 3 n=1 Tax=Channa argus TaxID=215402 RepID=A0A6G1Q0Q2_CHAAH|nr:Rhomboid domain-containing protein 3 [Channa argus]